MFRNASTDEKKKKKRDDTRCCCHQLAVPWRRGSPVRSPSEQLGVWKFGSPIGHPTTARVIAHQHYVKREMNNKTPERAIKLRPSNSRIAKQVTMQRLVIICRCITDLFK